MMDPLKKLALVLAALDLSPNELAYIEDRLRRLAPGQLRFIIERAARDAGRAEPDRPARTISYSSASVAAVGERVERLLKDDAGLPTQQAVHYLTEALLKEKLLRPTQIPPLSKKSLSSWVDRLVPLVDPKHLLRIATVIRNSVVHPDKTDWPGIDQ